MSAVAPIANVTAGPTVIALAMPTQMKEHKKAAIAGNQRPVVAQGPQEPNAALAAAIDAVCDFASEKAEHLAATCGYQKDYYLRLMFSRGASRISESEQKSNPYNMWSYDLPKRYNQGPDSTKITHLIDLQREHRDEYEVLRPEEKRTLITVYEEDRKSRKSGLHINPRSRAQDIRQTFQAMQNMFFDLKLRSGCDGFMCLVKNNNEIGIPPMWYFTKPEIDRYLSGTIRDWDIEKIGGHMQTFCIAGSDVMNYLRTNRDRASWIKKEIADKLNTMLAEITGNPKATMAYRDYEGKIVIGHGVVLEGWTHDTFAAPSCLPMLLEPLQVLLKALHSGQCHFRRLTGEELDARQAAYKQKMTDGTITGGKERSQKRARREDSPSASADSSLNL